MSGLVSDSKNINVDSFNVLTPKSDKDKIFLIIAIWYQADKWWELRKLSIRGLLVDPIPISPNQYNTRCVADRKEN